MAPSPSAVSEAVTRLAPGIVVALGGTAAVCDALLTSTAGRQQPPAEQCIDDPRGDANVGPGEDPSGSAIADLTRVCARYGSELSLAVEVAQPLDPNTDPGWTNVITELYGFLDVDRDGNYDYELAYINLGGEGLTSYVRDAQGNRVCDATAGYDGRYLISGIGSECVGASDNFLLDVSIAYDSNSYQDELAYPPTFEVVRDGSPPPLDQPGAQELVLAPDGRSATR